MERNRWHTLKARQMILLWWGFASIGLNIHGPKIKDIRNIKIRGPILGENTITLAFATYSCPFWYIYCVFFLTYILIYLSLVFSYYWALCEGIIVLCNCLGLFGVFWGSGTKKSEVTTIAFNVKFCILWTTYMSTDTSTSKCLTENIRLNFRWVFASV